MKPSFWRNFVLSLSQSRHSSKVSLKLPAIPVNAAVSYIGDPNASTLSFVRLVFAVLTIH
jgi:hypothetical protein